MQPLVDDRPLLQILGIERVVVGVLVDEVGVDGVTIPYGEVLVLQGGHRVERIDLKSIRVMEPDRKICQGAIRFHQSKHAVEANSAHYAGSIPTFRTWGPTKRSCNRTGVINSPRLKL